MAELPDVRKTVTVDAPVDDAFAIFAKRPIEWWPPTHVFVTDRQSITIEPRAGGRYFERGGDGREVAWGTVVEWDPPHHIVLTWRVGPGWQPIFDDERASFIEVNFRPVAESVTEVSLTHRDLHRHGEIAGFIHAALEGPSPGETLQRYAEVVAKHVPNGDDEVILVNRFTVTGPSTEFERAFAATAEFFVAQPGFVDYHLMCEVDEPGSYVNVARWKDQESLHNAVSHPDFRRHAEAMHALSRSEPKVYRVRQSARTSEDPANPSSVPVGDEVLGWFR